MRDTVTITITYPTPATQRDADAVNSVLIAADPYWAADYSSESTPGKVVVTIDAAGWPVVAAAIDAARRVADPGWSISSTCTPPATLEHSMFDHGCDGQVRGRRAPSR
jgi:hypothetical protein